MSAIIQNSLKFWYTDDTRDNRIIMLFLLWCGTINLAISMQKPSMVTKSAIAPVAGVTLEVSGKSYQKVFLSTVDIVTMLLTFL